MAKLYGIHIKNQNRCFDKNSPHICIGWHELGDLLKYKTSEELVETINTIYNDKTNLSKTIIFKEIKMFLFDAQIDDYVVCNYKHKLYIGKITSNYYYKNDFANQDMDYVHNRNVIWLVRGIVDKDALSIEASKALDAQLSFFEIEEEFKNEILSLIDEQKNRKIMAYYNDKNILTCEGCLSKDDWIKILKDSSEKYAGVIDLLKYWCTKNNFEASCKQIGKEKFFDKKNSAAIVNGMIVSFCRMVCAKKKVIIIDETGNSYFLIMMNGKYSKYEGKKVYNWIVRSEVVLAINELFPLKNEKINIEETYQNNIYAEDQFLADVYISKEDYILLKNLLEYKKNIILQGAPGVGKTFVAKRLAYAMISKTDDYRIETVQFHQSYSYEDFIMGYRPVEDGFKLQYGIFYNFCKRAEKDEHNKYFFIIDEINRGNLSKIFGELFMLMEKDKRDIKVKLLYNEELFSIPKNVYIIGTMNTADRSLAMVDYALRRRFSFYTLKPAFDNETFVQYKDNLQNTIFNNLIDKIKELNNTLINDPTLGEDFVIGHSYFSNFTEVDNNILFNIVEYEIIPLLKEYWFNEPEKINDWSNKLRGLFK